jgi:transposase
MQITLTTIQKTELEARHKKERDGRIRDRIKAVLLCNEGWSQIQIAQALRIRPETVHDHLKDFINDQKLKPENGGSESHLNQEQTAEVIRHLEYQTYMKVYDICAYIQQSFDVKLTVSGMTKWLHKQGFSYKKPKATPAKANLEQQAVFIKYYEKLLNTLPENEPVEFADGVHPTMATKITYGWIRKGTDKPIMTSSSKTKMNLFGSISLETMNITIDAYETIDSIAIDQHFQKLRQKYPKAPKIHLILDQGSYNTSKQTKESAEKYNIVLHHLPPYSPNLNPIERLWKIMNEHARNNRYFQTAAEFKKAIMDFFEITWDKIAFSMIDRINDNFQVLKQAS